LAGLKWTVMPVRTPRTCPPECLGSQKGLLCRHRSTRVRSFRHFSSLKSKRHRRPQQTTSLHLTVMCRVGSGSVFGGLTGEVAAFRLGERVAGAGNAFVSHFSVCRYVCPEPRSRRQSRPSQQHSNQHSTRRVSPRRTPGKRPSARALSKTGEARRIAVHPYRGIWHRPMWIKSILDSRIGSHRANA